MMQIAEQISLNFDERMTGRAFTHPDYVQKDRDVLLYMAKQVCSVMEVYHGSLQAGRPVFVDEADGRWHRCQVPRPMALRRAKFIYVVGFFGQVREEANPNFFLDLSERLVAHIPSFQEILSYNTMALPNGDFSNLVLLSDEEIKSKWMEGKTHSKAVSLSPRYYRSVRINNGVLPKGILQLDALRITKVKYYDYRETPPWRAVRKLH